MTTYSFRAECSHDVQVFITRARQACYEVAHGKIYTQQFRGTMLPDVKFQFDSNATIEQLQQVMAGIEDSHVMAETLLACPLAENPLRRKTLL